MNLYKILAFVLKSILLLSISSQAQNTFKVDSVKVASKPLKVFNVDTLLKLKTQHQIVYMPESLKGIKLHPSYNNGLVDAVYEAYSSHRPLILSPDIVWLTISQGVSIHINQNFDKLKTKLFKSPEPVQLLVRNDSIEIKPQYWTSVINEFAGQTKANTKGDFYNILVPQFSTTTKDITTAYQINLMETYRQAFEYLGESGCGIPTITLEGTKEDWQLIYNQLDNLNQFGLQEWVKELKPVIQEFINTYDQKTNQKFWSSIYKDASEYGAFYVSGWIIKFFPYLTGLDFDSKVVQDKSKGNDENDFTRKVKKNYYLNPYIKGYDYLMSTISNDNFPKGISEVEVKWKNHFTGLDTKYLLYSGFVGIQQFENKAIKPYISWMVTNEPRIDFEVILPSGIDTNDVFKKGIENFWSPDFTDSLHTKAIYDIKKNKTYEESLKYLKSYFYEAIKQNQSKFTAEALKSEFQFVVLSNGVVTDLKLINNKEIKGLEAFLRNKLLELSAIWFPATTKFKNLKLMEDDEQFDKLLIKVNSRIVIKF